MAFSCTRSKTKEDIYRNDSLEQRISSMIGEDLELTNLNLTDLDVPTIIRKGIRKKKVRSLTLTNNQLSSVGVRLLVDCLKSNQKLTHLTLSGNPIGDESMEHLIELIENSRSLYHLSLSDTGITDQACKAIARSLQSNRSILRCLDLRSNKSITDESIDTLLEMVDQNQTLSACRLDNCGLTTLGKDKLREAKDIRW